MIWDAFVAWWHEFMVLEHPEIFVVVDLLKFGVDGLGPEVISVFLVQSCCVFCALWDLDSEFVYSFLGYLVSVDHLLYFDVRINVCLNPLPS